MHACPDDRAKGRLRVWHASMHAPVTQLPHLASLLTRYKYARCNEGCRHTTTSTHQRTDARHHVRRVTGRFMIVCETCGEKHVTNTDAKHHQQREHPKDDTDAAASEARRKRDRQYNRQRKKRSSAKGPAATNAAVGGAPNVRVQLKNVDRHIHSALAWPDPFLRRQQIAAAAAWIFSASFPPAAHADRIRCPLPTASSRPRTHFFYKSLQVQGESFSSALPKAGHA